MGEPGVAKVKLHKQAHQGLVSKTVNEVAAAEHHNREDPEELTKEDFEKAADKAEETANSVTQRVQEGTAGILGKLQEVLLPKPGEKAQQDPEVTEFRAAAAEAAAEAKAYMQPGSQKAEQKPDSK